MFVIEIILTATASVWIFKEVVKSNMRRIEKERREREQEEREEETAPLEEQVAVAVESSVQVEEIARAEKPQEKKLYFKPAPQKQQQQQQQPDTIKERQSSDSSMTASLTAVDSSEEFFYTPRTSKPILQVRCDSELTEYESEERSHARIQVRAL